MAPAYKQPPMPIPLNYKESGTWVMSKPSLFEAKKNAPWWAMYEDKTLNQLEQKVTTGNQNLKIAFERYEEAKAILESARSKMYPSLLGIAGESRQKNSRHLGNAKNNSNFIYDTISLGGYLSYEIDAWGMVRNQVSAAKHLALASKYDLAAIDLSLHALLASTYFQLQGDNQIQVVLDNNVRVYQKALYLTRQLHRVGAASALEEDEIVRRLERAQASAIDMQLKRAQLEHALAILVGEIPANFHMPPVKKQGHTVTVSPNLPSTLLAQRPDIAAAAERVQSANATIGVARAAFLPQLNLGTIVGYQSDRFSNLFSTPSFIWSLGPPSSTIIPVEVVSEAQQILFDGFKLQALLKKAKSSYYQSVDYYKQVVLNAFKEVEDSLVAVHKLDQEYSKQTVSTTAAKAALNQANHRWKVGIYTFLNVVLFEIDAIDAEIELINISTRRQIASVHLIEALGGGWCSKCG